VRNDNKEEEEEDDDDDNNNMHNPCTPSPGPSIATPLRTCLGAAHPGRIQNGDTTFEQHFVDLGSSFYCGCKESVGLCLFADADAAVVVSNATTK
jgi:hypothetical protein